MIVAHRFFFLRPANGFSFSRKVTRIGVPGEDPIRSTCRKTSPRIDRKSVV